MEALQSIIIKDIFQEQHELRVSSSAPVLDALIKLRKLKQDERMVMGQQALLF